MFYQKKKSQLSAYGSCELTKLYEINLNNNAMTQKFIGTELQIAAYINKNAWHKTISTSISML